MATIKRPNRKNKRLVREISLVPNGQGNVSLYADKVNAYCKRVGIHIKGYTDFVKLVNELEIEINIICIYFSSVTIYNTY